MRGTQWNKILEILEKIGNINFQKDVWKDQKYFDNILSYGEGINTLDDYFFFDAIENRELPLDANLYLFIDDYIKKLLSYKDSKVMFDDPVWLKLVERTHEVIRIIKDAI
jgi:hypothetical protein